jgi:cytochrome d ubiquinol oxidase subunit I
MVLLGMYFILLMAVAAWKLWRGRLWQTRWLLKVIMFSIPLPVIATQLGWIAAEVGRQPWIVYRLLRTAEAHSTNVTASEVLFSIVMFGLIYLTLGAFWLFLMFRKAKQGPEPLPVKAQ